MSFRGRYFTWHQRFLCQHKDLEYQEHPFDVHPKLCQAFRITDKYATIEELSESIGPKPDVFRHFSLKSWKHAQLHWFVSIACNLLYVTSMHFTQCAFVIAELLSRHDKSAKMHSGINNSPASLALERQPKHSLKQSDLHHWEPVNAAVAAVGAAVGAAHLARALVGAAHVIVCRCARRLGGAPAALTCTCCVRCLAGAIA